MHYLVKKYLKMAVLYEKKPSFLTTLTRADTQIRTGDLILTKH